MKINSRIKSYKF